MSEERNTQEIFEEIWAPIVMKDGVLDAEQVKLELLDYHQLIRRVSEVYEEITGGKLSKPTYLPGVVLDEYRRQMEEAGGLCRECGEDLGVDAGEERSAMRG